MSRDVVKELNRKLEETGPGVSLAVETCFDCYFDVVRGLVDVFGPKNDLESIYVTASIPASTMLNALEALDADTGRLYFVDCLSHMIMGNIEPNDRIIFLENPTMLEYIILKVEYLIRRFENRSCLVILDSIDSLAIHNDLKILSRAQVEGSISRGSMHEGTDQSGNNRDGKAGMRRLSLLFRSARGKCLKPAIHCENLR